MPSFADSIFLFVLALLLFGPKKLPVLARELGKWMGEFRRASNEFKMQMEDELRASEQADRQKQIAAMEAAAPIPPPLDEPAEPEHPHLRHRTPAPAIELTETAPSFTGDADAVGAVALPNETEPVDGRSRTPEPTEVADIVTSETPDGARPVPIATSGNLKMMPPATGLPTPRSGRAIAVSSHEDALPDSGTATDATEVGSVAHGG